MFDVDEPISDYQKTIRERASQSLGPLRYALDSSIKYSPASSQPAVDSYTSAVTRLKTLLQQYEDAKVPQQQQQMLLSESARPLDGVMSSQRSSLPNPDEVAQLLNSHFAVVQHLEGQVDFYKSALEALKRQTQLLIRENETLFDQLKTQALTQVLTAEQQSEKEHPTSNDKKDTSQKQTQTGGDTSGYVLGERDDEEEEEVLRKPHQGRGVEGTDSKVETGRHRADVAQRLQKQHNPRQSVMAGISLKTSLVDSVGVGNLESRLFMSAKEKRFVLELEEEVEKIRKLHEAKTRHLETLLYSTRDELEEYQRQLSELQAKAKTQRMLAEQPAYCVKCGQRSAVFASSHSEPAMDTIDKLTRERDDLMNTLTGQKAVLAEVRQREFEAYNQVKKSCHMVEQAQLEKAEAIIQVHQLREDLQNERQRHDKFINSSNERMEKECEKVRAARQAEIEALVKQLESSIEAHSALENKLDRVTREKVDLASELEQAKSQIMAHASEMSQVDVNMHKELEQTMMRHSMASQEIASLRTAAQQAVREREQERTRLAGEIEVLRRRLHDAEQGWMESKEECIALTELLNKAEREAKSATITKEKLVEAKSSEVENLKQQNRRREEHFTTLLQETETRHTQCRAELQQMLEAEIHVCSQMKEECMKLTGQLQDSSDKSRAKLLEAKEMKKKLDECFAERRRLAEQSRRKDGVIQELTSKLKKSGENARKQIDQMKQVLAARNALMKERKVLSQEVEFLRKQWLVKQPTEPVTPVETGSNASTEDAVRHDEGKSSAE